MSTDNDLQEEKDWTFKIEHSFEIKHLGDVVAVCNKEELQILYEAIGRFLNE